MASPLVSDNIILTGFMGCGKSYFASRLAKALGYELTDTDEMIEEQEKRSIKEIFANDGETYFRELEAKIAEKIKSLDHCVISTGGGFPIYYNDIKKLGTVIYMDISFEDIVKRMSPEDIKKRPLFSDLHKAKSLYNERKSSYCKNSDYQLDASSSIDEMIRSVRKFINENH